MHLLVISLLTILAGTLLLAKFQKEMAGKFFRFVSLFFIVVGFVLFVGFLAGGIVKMARHDLPCQQNCGHEMMMKGWHHGMPGKMCCPPKMCCPQGMDNGMYSKGPGCMPHDSMMKCCKGTMKCDTVNMAPPKNKQGK